MRIVVAANPIPIAPRLELEQKGEVVCDQIVGALAAMEAITKRDHAGWVDLGEELAEARKRRTRIVRRQQHAERGVCDPFFKMEIGNEKRVLRFPIKRARGQWLQHMA